MDRRSRERSAVAVLALAFAGLYGLTWVTIGPIATVPALALVLGIVVAVQLDLARRTRADARNHASQTQQYVGLQAALAADQPLPPLGGYAVEPDCAATLARHILAHRPRLIVEAGCGSSTIVAAYCLRRIGAGRLVALEQCLPWAALIREDLRSRGLEDFAEVRDAPLEPQRAGGEEWPWFAARTLSFDGPIDMLFVDGPPAVAHREARFPALPLLAGKLSGEAWILCDDANRRGERRILDRWRELFPDIEVATLPTKRGTALIRFRR